MYVAGILLFLLATIILFGSDIMARRGKIKDIKQLFIVKMAGLGILFIGVLLMFLK